MQKKIKVVFENGGLKPLEPLELNKRQEGFFIFDDEQQDNLTEVQLKSHLKAVLSEKSLNKVWDNSEDDIYNDV